MWDKITSCIAKETGPSTLPMSIAVGRFLVSMALASSSISRQYSSGARSRRAIIKWSMGDFQISITAKSSSNRKRKKTISRRLTKSASVQTRGSGRSAGQPAQTVLLYSDDGDTVRSVST